MMHGSMTPPHSAIGPNASPSSIVGSNMGLGAGPAASGGGQTGAGNSNTSGAPTAMSSYPLPPMQYIKDYTDENIARGRAPEPPRILTDGTYTMFGAPMVLDEAIIRPLESQGIKRLYPRDYDHKRELKKMNASILVNFLDLIDVLVKCPDTGKREEKCGDISMLFIQMHHLINELRPHQARETIRVTLDCQKRQRIQIITRLVKQVDRVNDIILGCVNSIPDAGDTKLGLEELGKLGQMINGLEKDALNGGCAEENNDYCGQSSENIEMNEFDSIMCDIVDEL